MSTVIFNGYNGHECGLPYDELAETETYELLNMSQQTSLLLYVLN
jgi:hypothetical protein